MAVFLPLPPLVGASVELIVDFSGCEIEKRSIWSRGELLRDEDEEWGVVWFYNGEQKGVIGRICFTRIASVVGNRFN